MELQLLFENLSNPALLFFFLGLIAVRLKSDLQIPPNSSRFISLYLLLSIGFKGGQELAHSTLDAQIVWSLLAGIILAVVVPFYTFFLLKKKLGVANAGAIAASYGSVSAVTFVTAVSFLDMHAIEFDGYMVAVMAFMEAPSIIVGVALVAWLSTEKMKETNVLHSFKHAVTNGSVLLIIGSLVIGFVASDAQAEGIKPFTTDLFKGFLAVFLLDMGITSGKKIGVFLDKGWFTLVFAIVVPLINGIVAAYLSGFITDSEGNRFLFAILAASASYIAVPAAMKIAVPNASPSLYLPMALGITFPLNITIGIPVYYSVVLWT